MFCIVTFPTLINLTCITLAPLHLNLNVIALPAKPITSLCSRLTFDVNVTLALYSNSHLAGKLYLLLIFPAFVDSIWFCESLSSGENFFGYYLQTSERCISFNLSLSCSPTDLYSTDL